MHGLEDCGVLSELVGGGQSALLGDRLISWLNGSLLERSAVRWGGQESGADLEFWLVRARLIPSNGLEPIWAVDP